MAYGIVKCKSCGIELRVKVIISGQRFTMPQEPYLETCPHCKTSMPYRVKDVISLVP
jgi:hypothetical protein